MKGRDSPDDSADQATRSDALQSIRESTTDQSPKRRSVLKISAASALASVGFTGLASAVDPRSTDVTQAELEQARQPYASEAAAMKALRTEGAQLLETLSEQGHVADASLDAFDLDTLQVGGVPVDGEATAHITVQSGDGVTAVVQPQADRQYAGVGEGDDTNVVQNDGTSLQSCTNETAEYQDSNCSCSTWAYSCANYKIACCDDGSCFLQERYDCAECCFNSSCYDVCG